MWSANAKARHMSARPPPPCSPAPRSTPSPTCPSRPSLRPPRDHDPQASDDAEVADAVQASIRSNFLEDDPWCGRFFSRYPRRDMAGYGGIPGDTGRYREIPGDTRYGQIRADTGRYGEMRGDARRYGEIQSDIGEIHQDTAKKPSTLGLAVPRLREVGGGHAVQYARKHTRCQYEYTTFVQRSTHSAFRRRALFRAKLSALHFSSLGSFTRQPANSVR